MSDTDWAEWIAFHATLFWMLSEQDGILFSEWRPSLAEYSLAELRAASRHIAESADKAARFRTNHLALIREHAQSGRFARQRAEDEELARKSAAILCRLCGGSARIAVPHVGCIVNGIWRHPYCTMAVACSCSRGSLYFNGFNDLLVKREKRIRLIAIDEYEQLHPDWRDLVRGREQQREHEAKSRWRAGEADRVAPLSLDRIREQLAAIGVEA